jgi:hypothetical protein
MSASDNSGPVGEGILVVALWDSGARSAHARRQIQTALPSDACPAVTNPRISI